MGWRGVSPIVYGGESPCTSLWGGREQGKRLIQGLSCCEIGTPVVKCRYKDAGMIGTLMERQKKILCPRCNVPLWGDEDRYGRYLLCIHCGYYLDIIKEIPRKCYRERVNKMTR
jgi:uncharacterized protein YbaR (Trm112 family)